MKIALLAPPYLPVPPTGYGGTERIISALADGLVGYGHDVSLFASGDSKTRARLVATVPKAIGNSGKLKNESFIPLLSYINCFEHADEFELIHNHAQYLAMFLSNFVSTPVAHTLHGSFYQGETSFEKRAALEKFRKHKFISISDNQQMGMKELNWIGTVYNGINLTEFNFTDKKGDYLLWVGRITPKKGALEAIKVANACGIKLKIAGVIDPIDQDFFNREIKPYIDSGQTELLGELNAAGKSRIYEDALATLYPISWHEPFGLVMVESMACGTPVIATRWGSVPELVEDGVTGFVVDTIDEMARKVKDVGLIKRSSCRNRVENKFTQEKMVEGYINIYKKILNT